MMKEQQSRAYDRAHHEAPTDAADLAGEHFEKGDARRLLAILLGAAVAIEYISGPHVLPVQQHRAWTRSVQGLMDEMAERIDRLGRILELVPAGPPWD
jgi:hypothetical protein